MVKRFETKMNEKDGDWMDEDYKNLKLFNRIGKQDQKLKRFLEITRDEFGRDFLFRSEFDSYIGIMVKDGLNDVKKEVLESIRIMNGFISPNEGYVYYCPNCETVYANNKVYPPKKYHYQKCQSCKRYFYFIAINVEIRNLQGRRSWRYLASVLPEKKYHYDLIEQKLFDGKKTEKYVPRLVSSFSWKAKKATKKKVKLTSTNGKDQTIAEVDKKSQFTRETNA